VYVTVLFMFIRAFVCSYFLVLTQTQSGNLV
jgi:hypothetical protein